MVNMTPQIWIFLRSIKAEPLQSWLQRYPCKLKIFNEQEFEAWFALPDELRQLPSLLIIDSELAWQAETQLLSFLKTTPPWSSLPVVLLTQREDPDACLRAYEQGAAAWACLESQAALDEFARYWLKTTLLPQLKGL